VDRVTVEVYDRSAEAYAERRSARRWEQAAAFASTLPEGSPRLDLGCGPGLYLPHLGTPVVAADAAHAMVTQARLRFPAARAVRCDLTALPFRAGAVAGVWASKAHQHVAATALPGALAELHRVLPVDGRLELAVFEGDGVMTTGDDDEFPGRLFTLWRREGLVDLLVGAGFDILAVEADSTHNLVATATRARTLADSVGPGMDLLLCGLNPSLYAADAGVAFARPGNRLWPALRAAGLASVDRDPAHLLAHHRIGMTDLVKRATVGAGEVSDEEYRAGLGRVARLCRLLEPAAVAVVGLAGWRAAVDRRSRPGWQEHRLGPAPVYLMPSSSGLNAHSQVPDLAAHLVAAASPLPSRR
jgi:TDG/mug DNA glycosylase family protein